MHFFAFYMNWVTVSFLNATWNLQDWPHSEKLGKSRKQETKYQKKGWQQQESNEEKSITHVTENQTSVCRGHTEPKSKQLFTEPAKLCYYFVAQRSITSKIRWFSFLAQFSYCCISFSMQSKKRAVSVGRNGLLTNYLQRVTTRWKFSMSLSETEGLRWPYSSNRGELSSSTEQLESH